MKLSYSALGLVLACAGTFALAAGCGSDDGKQKARDEAGAAGASAGEAGGPGSGGSDGAPDGASGESGAATVSGGAGAGGDGPAAGGQPPASAGAGGDGGAPGMSACTVGGSVEDFEVNPEPTYAVCRGSVLRVEFEASSASESFTCCATSSGDEPFVVPVLGRSFDEGGELEFTIPDAPYATYAVSLACSGSTDQVIGIHLSDGLGPIVTSISASIDPTSLVQIEGENLGTQGIRVGATRARDGRYFECVFDSADQTPTSITCSFSNIEPSQDQDDLYVIDVYSSECGHAPNPPSFLVGPPPT